MKRGEVRGGEGKREACLGGDRWSERDVKRYRGRKEDGERDEGIQCRSARTVAIA